MSALVDRALAESGLLPIAEARRRGELARVEDLAAVLETADILAVGALADRVRAEEVGDLVGVLVGVEHEPGPDVVSVSVADVSTSGLAMLRRVAVARITGPRAARVRVDGAEVGPLMAEVALGFGASEISWATVEGSLDSKHLESIPVRLGGRAVRVFHPGSEEHATDA